MENLGHPGKKTLLIIAGLLLVVLVRGWEARSSPACRQRKSWWR